MFIGWGVVLLFLGLVLDEWGWLAWLLCCWFGYLVCGLVFGLLGFVGNVGVYVVDAV